MEGSYKISFALALLLHCCLLGFITIHKNREFKTLPSTNNAKAAPKEIIKAYSLSEDKVLEAVTKLKQEQLEKKLAAEKKERAMQDAMVRMQKKRIAEERRLLKIKQEQQKIAQDRKKQFSEHTKKLQDMALKKQIEEKKLEELRQQQLMLKKQNDEKILAAKRAKIASIVDQYKALILSAISRNWILPDDFKDTHLNSKFRIKLSSNGTVLEVSLIQSSGNSLLDRSAQSAIYKASPLPLPDDPEVIAIFKDITLTVRPENLRG